MVCDEQCALKVQFARQLAETVNYSCAKDHASTRLKVERPHLVAALGFRPVVAFGANV